VEEICRVALNRRYMLIPYIYTLFFFAYRDGQPVIEPLFFVDPVDPKLRSEDRAFLLGNILVIVDIYPSGSGYHPPVSIPTNVKWYSLKLDDFTSKELPELKIRAGSIILAQSPIEYISQEPQYMILIVALDSNGTASGNSYDDEGDGYEHENGYYLLTTYEAKVEPDTDILILNIKEEGNYPRKNVPLKIKILQDDREVCFCLTSNRLSELKFKLNSFIH